MTETGGPERATAADGEIDNELGRISADALRRRDAILEAALPDVAFDGWTLAVLVRGAEAAGLAREEAVAAFPGGAGDVLPHFSDWADRRMLERLVDVDLGAIKVRERVALAVRTRLAILEPWKEAVRRSATLLALPPLAPQAARIVARTSDVIWIAAGDTSTDYNYYTKRLLLGGVLTSTLLFWLEDKSEGHVDTEAFLARRIEDVMRIGRGVGQLKTLGAFVERIPSPVRFLRQMRGQGH